MHTSRNLRLFLSLAAVFTAFLAAIWLSIPVAQAAEQSGSGAALGVAALDTAGAVAQPFIVGFAERHPWLVTALAVIATLRLVFKPLMSAAHVFVRSTPGTADDAMLDRVEHSTAFRIFAWLLDYLGSIKVGPQKPDTPRPPEPHNSEPQPPIAAQ